jgi:putative membrane protein
MKIPKCFALLFSGGLSLFLLLSGTNAFAQWRGGYGGYGGWGMGPGMMGGWGTGGFGGIFMIIFWILIIVGGVFLVKWLIQSTKGGSGRPFSSSSGALDILKERYAKGEIGKEEFEEKKKDLL